MRIVITGATGFLGRHTARQLAGTGHSLLCLSRSGTLPAGLPPTDTVQSASVDVMDEAALDAAFDGQDVLVHAAGVVSHSLADAARTTALHITGTDRAMRAARRAGIKRVIYLSTSGTIAVGTDPNQVFDEDAPPPLDIIDRWPYYRSKLFAEQIALKHNDADLPVICLNPSLLLGPGDDPLGKSTEAVRTFLDDGVPLAPPGGIAFVDVRDVADAIERALTRGTPGQRYLLNGCNQTFEAFFARLGRLSGKAAPMGALPGRATREALRWLPGLGRDGGIGIGVGARISREDMELASHTWSCDSSRAQKALGWNPRDPLETLRDTIADLRSHQGSVFDAFATFSAGR